MSEDSVFDETRLAKECESDEAVDCSWYCSELLACDESPIAL